jgi:lipoteichoic acid synthase
VSVYGLLAFSFLLKLLLASYLSDTLYLSPPWVLGSFGCLGLTLLPLTPLKGRQRTILAAMISLSAGLLAVTDLTYYRYFIDLPSAAQLGQAGQLQKVGSSVLSLLRPYDLLFFLDLPAYYWLLKRPYSGESKGRRLLWFATLLTLSSGLLWLADRTKTATQRGIENRRFKNYALAREFGLPVYHVQDLTQHFARKLTSARKPVDLSPYLVGPERALKSISDPSPYWGLGKGQNVLVVILETWQGFSLNLTVDGQEVMPYLSQLKRDCLYFRHVYDQTNHAPSADGEFILANSLHPASSGATVFVFQGNRFHALPSMLKDAGYSTSYFGYYDGGFWNARVMNQSYGCEQLRFADFGPPPTPPERVGWSLADYPLLSRVQTELSKQQQPFYAVVKSSMGHHPFRELKKEQQWLRLEPELANSVLGDFLQTCRFRDRNLELFIKEFKRSPLSKNTILVLVGDHSSAMTADDLAPLYPGSPLPARVEWARRQTVPMLIHLPDSKGEEFTDPMGQTDIAPTLLHLLGITPREPVFMGQNALNRSGPVCFRRAACAIDDGILVSVLNNQAYDLEAGRAVPLEQHSNILDNALREWQLSDQILKFDLIPELRERWRQQSSRPSSP